MCSKHGVRRAHHCSWNRPSDQERLYKEFPVLDFIASGMTCITLDSRTPAELTNICTRLFMNYRILLTNPKGLFVLPSLK